MMNISTTVRGHYGNDMYLWAIIIRRFYDSPSVGFIFTKIPLDPLVGFVFTKMSLKIINDPLKYYFVSPSLYNWALNMIVGVPNR
jgi:hypothetical protein